MDFTKTKAIVIDAMGTLIQPSPSVGGVYARVLEAEGIHLPADAAHKFNKVYASIYGNLVCDRKMEGVNARNEKAWWLMLVQQVLSCVLPTVPATTLKSAAKLCWEAFGNAENWDEITGIRPTLEALVRCDYRVYIFSASDDRLRKVFKGLGFTSFVEDIFTATDLGYRKPHAQSFAAVQDAIGYEPSQILYISPKTEDIPAAIAAGWQAAFLGDHSPSPEAFTLPQAGALLNHLLR